ncbi:hypothetical protein PSYAC_29306, partial [Pseudomonas syringae pv. actinidiae str. M302091]
LQEKSCALSEKTYIYAQFILLYANKHGIHLKLY